MEKDEAFTPGWYVTADGMDMPCFDGDMWHCSNLEGEPMPFADGDLGTMEWDVVRRTFSESSFPLRHVCPRMPPSASRLDDIAGLPRETSTESAPTCAR